MDILCYNGFHEFETVKIHGDLFMILQCTYCKAIDTCGLTDEFIPEEYKNCKNVSETDKEWKWINYNESNND